MREIYTRLTDVERAALKGHLAAVADRDKDKRRRAMKKYRVWLDYMERTGKISAQEKIKLEYYKMKNSHL